ncbi:MAG: FAD-binding oxidoreductase [Gammaproteobacteria bacterium]|nr:FAD-binding oxidoreductase [Gammaproteobacteria bacterium]
MLYDVIVIGGGMVGASTAYGLAKQGQKVLVLDGEDLTLSASKANFGLVWVQGKGWDHAPYAQWCQIATNLWPELSDELKATQVDISYQRRGGFDFCINEQEWQERESMMSALWKNTDGMFEYEMLNHSKLKKMIPEISKSVIGASFSPQDGHVDPLALLQALCKAMQNLGVTYMGNCLVEAITPKHGEYVVKGAKGVFTAGKIVLCAGLANGQLGEQLGMNIPVVAERGQVLITERLKPFLKWPTLNVRQTAQGTVQIGDSHEDVGLNDGTTPEVLKQIAQRAVLMFPLLSSVHLVRAWGGLRILTPDGNPIYQQSTSNPGVFSVTCHSGVTLAAAHAGPLCDWILGDSYLPVIEQFSMDRFDV